MSRFLSSTALLATLSAFSISAIAQTVDGRVTDARQETGFEGAQVTLVELNRSVVTDRFGAYRFANVPEGDYTLRVNYIGAEDRQQSVSVPASGVTVNFELGSDVDYIDNIIVVGTYAAQAGAINQQRNSGKIVSVIDSDGLGYFPDTTVADSLQRLPGLSIQTDQGEGRYVSIRGLNSDLVSASINGVRTPSPEDRRGVLLDGVPSDLLDGIEVQKSLTPDVDGDSLGGVINLKTISAFDRDGMFIRAKVEGQYNEITEEVSPKATLTYSNVFGENFGAAISLNYQDLRIEAHNNETGEWGLDNGVYFLNDDYEHRWYDLTRQRLGLVANFDWRVSENTNLYFRTLLNEYRDDEVRNKFEFRDLDDGAANGPTQTIVPLNEMDAEVRLREEVRKIKTVSIGGDSTWDDWKVDYQISYAYAEEDDSNNHDVTFRFEDIQASFPGDVTFDYSTPETPVLSGAQNVIDAIYDPSNYTLDDFEREFTVNEDTETAGQFNIAKAATFMNRPVDWKGGVKYRSREKVRDANLTFHDPSLSLSDYVAGDFVDNWRLANPQPLWPDPYLTAAIRNQLDPADFDEEGSFFESNAEDFRIEENILAFYGMGTFDLGETSIIAGIRVESTDTELTGKLVEEDDLSFTNRTVSNDYTNVLPSVNIRHNFTDNVVGRAAYYAAIVRPAFGDMAPYVIINDDRDEALVGNPNLKPYEADNFDLSLEFYPTKLSVLSATVFYKNISDPIYPANFDIADVPSNIDLSGIPAVYLNGDDTDGGEIEEIDSFINVDSAKVLGLELNYVQGLADIFPALDGFIVSSNLTLTESEATLPDGREVTFLAQADTVFNFAIAYDKGPWDLRISSNYRGSSLDELVDPDLDRFNDDRTLVEASAKYRLNDSWLVYVEGKNLTDAPEYYYFGDESRLSQYDEFGRSVIFGARFTY